MMDSREEECWSHKIHKIPQSKGPLASFPEKQGGEEDSGEHHQINEQ